MPQLQFSFIIDLFHDTFDQRRLTFTVLSDESDLVPSVDSQCDILEDQMIPITFSHILHNHRVRTGTGSRRKFQVQHGCIYLIHFDTLYLFQLFDA